MTTTLITGASGFVGLNLCERLLGEGRSVICWSAQAMPVVTATAFRALPGELKELTGDVRDRAALAAVMRGHRVERVAHLAAVTAGTERERVAADDVLSVNLSGLAAVMTACAEAGVPRFVHTGSIAVYGGWPPDGSLIDEDTPHAPQSLYGISKSCGEAVVARLGALHGLDWVIGRLGRVFGRHERDTGVRDTLSQIYQVSVAAREGRSVHFARPCRKNWNDARDTAAQLQALLDAPSFERRHRIYNLGSQHAFTLADWCQRLADRYPTFRYAVGAPGDNALRDSIEIDLVGDRDSGLLSWQRFERTFGFAARQDFDAAFNDYTLHLDAA